MKVFTIGCTKKSAETFFGLLRESGATRIVDIRRNNTSQLAGFAKKDDLVWFARELCGMGYVHLPVLAPTRDLLSDYLKKRITWESYQTRFTALMEARRIQSELSVEDLTSGCLLCSCDRPENCHRRLVAEYLNKHWGGLEIEHLGFQGTRR